MISSKQPLDDAYTMMSSPEPSPALPSFILHHSRGGFEAKGIARALPAGDAATLGARVHKFFGDLAFNDRAADVLVGALPFDPGQPDYLYQPLSVRSYQASGWLGSRDRSDGVAPLTAIRTQQQPTALEYKLAVEGLRSQLAAVHEVLGKVVLARTLLVETSGTIDVRKLVARLNADPQVTTFLTPLPVTETETPAWLVGATPELLVSRRGTRVVSHPLAGSIPRQADAIKDQQAANMLLASDKDYHEHRFVVEAILDTLAPLCSQLKSPSRPGLKATESMWHLGTEIVGQLRDRDISVAELAAALHPTPAVCGTPRPDALQKIREIEPFERGFYGGAVGYVDAQGDGDWYVAIRCAKVQDHTIRLFAGAGIVADSTPELEVEETSAKFKALLTALGISDREVQ